MIGNDILTTFGAAIPEEFEPCVYYDRDGDTIEFFSSDEPFYGERLDDWVTVYRGEESDEIVGSLIKGVHGLIANYPGFDIEIEEDGKVCLEILLRASAWVSGDPVVKKTYKLLITRASGLQVQLCASAA